MGSGTIFSHVHVREPDGGAESYEAQLREGLRRPSLDRRRCGALDGGSSSDRIRRARPRVDPA